MTQFIQTLVDGLAAGSILSLISIGFVLIYKATDVVNFAQGEIMMIGAFVAFTFIVILGMNYWIAIVATALVVALLSYLLDATIVRRVIGQPQFSIVMLTIGFGFIFRAVSMMIWSPETLAFSTPFTGRTLTMFGVVISEVAVAAVAGTVILCLVLYFFFASTRIGVAMQAASQNQLAAYYMGVPVKRLNSLVWAISGAVSAIAGILLAPITLVDTQMGLLGFKAFAAAVIGGFGSIPGALLGGLLIGVMEQLSASYLFDGAKEVVAYVLLLVVLIFLPKGLLGRVKRKKV